MHAAHFIYEHNLQACKYYSKKITRIRGGETYNFVLKIQLVGNAFYETCGQGKDESEVGQRDKDVQGKLAIKLNR